MKTHYSTLGLSPGATIDQVRRAYRILARRYHPDLNPGADSEKFRTILEAYQVLSDKARKDSYDETIYVETFRTHAFKAYERQQRAGSKSKTQSVKPPPSASFKASNDTAGKSASRTAPNTATFSKAGARVQQQMKKGFESFARLIKSAKSGKSDRAGTIQSVTVIEVNCSLKEAALGCRKKISMARKAELVLSIPPATRDGALLRSKKDAEEYLFIIRVAKRQGFVIEQKGLVVEIPVTPSEAILGSEITVPGVFESNHVTIHAGSVSGTEVRVQNKGLPTRKGTRGDLFYRVIVQVPDCPSAVGIGEKARALDEYFSQPVRSMAGPTLFEDAA